MRPSLPIEPFTSGCVKRDFAESGVKEIVKPACLARRDGKSPVNDGVAVSCGRSIAMGKGLRRGIPSPILQA